MSVSDISQIHANTLLAMSKIKVDDSRWQFPEPGTGVTIPLISIDRRESFTLDIGRGRINLTKGTLQNRYRQAVILARLDFDGPPHRNPDGTEIGPNHLHVYREKFGDKWAIDAPIDKFQDLNDTWQTLLDFMSFCNVIDPPAY